MNRALRWAAAGLLLFGAAWGCGITEVSTERLAAIVDRDAVGFVGDAIPTEIIDRLGSHPVVVVGETHFLWEHRAFMVALMKALHARGFRQLLIEFPQMADWLVADYARDGDLLPEWQPPISLLGGLIDPLREFNRSLPPEERIALRGIDMNLDDYGGASSFVSLLRTVSGFLPDAGPLAAFLQRSYATPTAQRASLQQLDGELTSQHAALAAAWGAQWFTTIAEMVEVELASIDIRATRSSDYDGSARRREDVIKSLVDRRLAGFAHGTVINIGGNHAQKATLKGTKQEWLGDYLVHRSSAVSGTPIVLAVAAGRIIAASGSSTANWDLSETSPANELWRLMLAARAGQSVFLPLDDPVFLDGGVPWNFEDEIYVTAPQRYYDAALAYPLTNRVPLD